MQHKPMEVFNFLQNHSHRVNEFAAGTLFPTMYENHSNDTQYWLYSDLARYFPQIHSEPNGQNISENIRTDLVRIYMQNGFKKPDDNINFNNVFYRHVELFKTNSLNKHEDAKMTRFASAAATRMPETIFAHLYFIMPDAAFKEIKQVGYNVSRIFRRQQLSNTEKNVNSILHSLNIDFEMFSAIANQALFHERSIIRLKNAHNIKINSNDPISNYMQYPSLGARAYGLNCAIQEYKTHGHRTPEKFIDLARQHLERARTLMLKNYGHAPEQDLSPAHISKIQSQYNKLLRDFITKYKEESLHTSK